MVQKLGLTVEEKRIMRFGALNEPLNRAINISPSRYVSLVLRIVGEHDDIPRLVTVVPCQ